MNPFLQNYNLFQNHMVYLNRFGILTPNFIPIGVNNQQPNFIFMKPQQANLLQPNQSFQNILYQYPTNFQKL